MSVGARLMKGENDDCLSWPFRGTLTIQLINQKRDKQHAEDWIDYYDAHGDDVCGRVVNGKVTDIGMVASFGPAISKFIELGELLSPSDQTCYLQHNKLKFRIKQAAVYTSRVSSKIPKWATSPGKYVAEFTMTNFQEHRETNDPWGSPPFYTHNGGYKLCIAVYANGVDSGAGSHVSVYVHMMAGPNDDQLKWPFEAKITVQMINWKRDRNHVQRTVVIDCDDFASARVMNQVASSEGTGWDNFISHEQLLDTTSEDTLYVEDGSIRLRVLDIQCWGKATASSTGMLNVILYLHMYMYMVHL